MQRQNIIDLSLIELEKFCLELGLKNFTSLNKVLANFCISSKSSPINTFDKKIATDIALDIREAGRAKRDKNGNIIRDKFGKMLKKPGSLKYCKAVGWYIDEYNQAQVSINLTNYKKTSNNL